MFSNSILFCLKHRVELSDALLLPGREVTFFVSISCLNFTAKRILICKSSALDCIVKEFISFSKLFDITLILVLWGWSNQSSPNFRLLPIIIFALSSSSIITHFYTFFWKNAAPFPIRNIIKRLLWPNPETTIQSLVTRRIDLCRSVYILGALWIFARNDRKLPPQPQSLFSLELSFWLLSSYSNQLSQCLNWKRVSF